jgi:hypothetical protein
MNNPKNPFNFPKPRNPGPFPFTIGEVPCDGCRLCCQNGDMLRLLPEDDPDQYVTVPHPVIPDALMLDHQPNGDCIYLGETGCTIYAIRPLMCREMDCRTTAYAYTYTQIRKFGRKRIASSFIRVWKHGRQLLKQSKAKNHNV